MLSVLLYGSECWVPLRKDLSFNHRCVRTAPGITKQRQWEECISSTMGRCRDHRDKAGEKASRMAWTPGEDARSSSPQDMPVWMVSSNTTMRRSKKEVERDLVKRDLKAVGICDGSWYSAEQYRGGSGGKHGAKA